MTNAENAENKNSKVKYSIIIPVRQINDFLEENIKHLKRLSYKEFEVIIVTDEMEEYPFGDARFRIVTSKTPGPAEKRNVGARNAKGGILAFLDDDAYPTSDWLTQADKVFDNPQVYALGGPAVTPLDARFLEKMSGRVMESYLASGNTTFRHIPSKEREINDYPSVNLLVRKDSFLKVDGFLADFWPGEDTKLCLDLINLHKKNFLYSPMPVVFHHRRDLFIPHLKQISRYGQHRGQFAKIFPQTSRLPEYFAPSLFILGLFAGPAAIKLFPFLAPIYFFVLGLYALLIVVESLRAFVKEKDLRAIFYVGAGIFLTHIIYGINFIIGLLKKPKLEYRSVDEKTGQYLGG